MKPEEEFEAEQFYAGEARHYESPGMERAQRRLTLRAVELLELKKGKVLDAGCGTGFSSMVLKDAGFEVVGVDISKEMLEKAKEKGVECVKADMADLPFEDAEFDAIVSISALQWLGHVRGALKEFKRVLKKGGKIVAQFYPKDERELEPLLKMCKRLDFKGGIVIDNPQSPKKKKVFLVVQS